VLGDVCLSEYCLVHGRVEPFSCCNNIESLCALYSTGMDTACVFRVNLSSFQLRKGRIRKRGGQHMHTCPDPDGRLICGRNCMQRLRGPGTRRYVTPGSSSDTRHQTGDQVHIHPDARACL
jgi:hypothetical protein